MPSLLAKENEILLRELKLVRESKRTYLYLLMVCQVLCGGGLPILLSMVPQFFVGWLEERQTPEPAVFCMIFGGLLLTTVLGMAASKKLDNELSALRREELQKYQRWYQQIDYEHLEDPAFAVKSESAIDALGGGSGFFAVYLNFLKMAEGTITALVSGILLVLLQPLLVVICSLIFLIKTKLSHKIGRYIRENEPERARLSRQKAYFSNIGYDFSYGKDVRMFQLSGQLRKRFEAKSEEFVQNVKKVSARERNLGLQMELFVLIRNLAVFFLIGAAYFQSRISISQVVLFLGMTVAFNTALDQLESQWVEFVRNAEYASNYFSLLDDPSYQKKPKEAQKFDGNVQEIVYADVGFAYPKTERRVLSHISLKIRKGEKIAFVGINGAGKSTMIKLMTRLFDVSEGAIYVNGINISQIDRKEYYEKFSVVYQDVNVYAGTILENVAGTEQAQADRARAVDCLTAMGLAKKIEALPKGYDTSLLKVIEESGVEFSGGESQKLAIARALYKDADVYILDEPTSALDALAEKEVFELFNRSVQEKTVVYISHRLSSTKFCDRIYLFDENGVQETGTHDELMARREAYYAMFETQAKYYRKGADGRVTDENL